MSQLSMSDAMKRKYTTGHNRRQSTKVFQNSQSVVGASRQNSQAGLRQASGERSRMIMPAYDFELEDLPEPMRTQLQHLIDARVEKAIVETLEPHRKKVTERIDDESVRTNALIKDRVTSQACRCTHQEEHNHWPKDPAQRMRTQLPAGFDDARSTNSRGSLRSGPASPSKGYGTSPRAGKTSQVANRSPTGRSSKFGTSINDDLQSQLSHRQSIGASTRNNFSKKSVKDAPLIASDGTLIFKHPTIRNYYEKNDKPELKDNPYNTMMNPYYWGNGYPGPYGWPHHGAAGRWPGYHPYGAYGFHPAMTRLNTMARRMKTRRKTKYQVSKNSRLASIRDDMASENSFNTDASLRSPKSSASPGSKLRASRSPTNRNIDDQEDEDFEEKVLPLYDPGFGGYPYGAHVPYRYTQMAIYNRYGWGGGHYGPHGYYGAGGYAAHWASINSAAVAEETMQLYNRKNGGNLNAF